MGYSSWGCKESDTTEQLTLSLSGGHALSPGGGPFFLQLPSSLYGISSSPVGSNTTHDPASQVRAPVRFVHGLLDVSA